MEKLELKHLTPYADKALKGLFFNNMDILTEIDFANAIISSLNNGNVEIKNFKPILRPLSNLIKENFNEIEEIVYNTEHYCDSYSEWLDAFIDNPSYEKLHQAHYLIIQELFKKHFDVFGLIDKGLAIDINTI